MTPTAGRAPPPRHGSGLSAAESPCLLGGRMDQINIGMIGGGTVGSGVFHALRENAGLIGERWRTFQQQVNRARYS